MPNFRANLVFNEPKHIKSTPQPLNYCYQPSAVTIAQDLESWATNETWIRHTLGREYAGSLTSGAHALFRTNLIALNNPRPSALRPAAAMLASASPERAARALKEQLSASNKTNAYARIKKIKWVSGRIMRKKAFPGAAHAFNSPSSLRSAPWLRVRKDSKAALAYLYKWAVMQ